MSKEDYEKALENMRFTYELALNKIQQRYEEKIKKLNEVNDYQTTQLL